MKGTLIKKEKGMTPRKWNAPELTGVAENRELQTRVTTLEVSMTALTNTVNSVASDVKSLSEITRQQGASTEKQISDLLVAVQAAKAPKETYWPVLLSLLSLVIVIGALCFTPLLREQTRQSKDISNVQESSTKHENLITISMEETKALIKDFEDHRRITDASIAKLDDKLQIEIGNAERQAQAKRDDSIHDEIVLKQEFEKADLEAKNILG